MQIGSTAGGEGVGFWPSGGWILATNILLPKFSV